MGQQQFGQLAVRPSAAGQLGIERSEAGAGDALARGVELVRAPQSDRCEVECWGLLGLTTRARHLAMLETAWLRGRRLPLQRCRRDIE